MLLKFPQQRTRDFPQQILEFTVGNQKLGFEVARILEVVIPKQISRASEGNAFFHGMMDIRGHLIPLIDIREKIGQAPATSDKPAHAIVFEIPGFHAGIIADSVARTLRQTVEGKVCMEFESPFKNLLFFLLEYDGEQIPVLKTDNLLAPSEIAFIEKIAQPG